MLMKVPALPRGRPSSTALSAYEAELKGFCTAILEINSTLDFSVSSRGWCYILEPHGLRKNDFDTAQELINDCRKRGYLPLDICAEDGSRSFDNLEQLDHADPEIFSRSWTEHLPNVHRQYTPFSFWEAQKYYVEMLVEKIDLKSLFSPVCAQFYIPIASVKGWADISQRAQIMKRFKYWEEERNKRCVLLYCGDHDPGGLNISDFLHSNLSDLAGAVDWDPYLVIIDRFGLNIDFIEEHGLTWIENLATAKGKYPLDDQRHGDHLKPYVQDYIRRFGVRKVEANALVVRSEAGRRLCLDAILKYVARTAPQKYQRALAPHRKRVQAEIRRQLREMYS
jgi:hypothetical protein